MRARSTTISARPNDKTLIGAARFSHGGLRARERATRAILPELHHRGEGSQARARLRRLRRSVVVQQAQTDGEVAQCRGKFAGAFLCASATEQQIGARDRVVSGDMQRVSIGFERGVEQTGEFARVAEFGPGGDVFARIERRYALRHRQRHLVVARGVDVCVAPARAFGRGSRIAPRALGVAGAGEVQRQRIGVVFVAALDRGARRRVQLRAQTKGDRFVRGVAHETVFEP